MYESSILDKLVPEIDVGSVGTVPLRGADYSSNQRGNGLEAPKVIPVVRGPKQMAVSCVAPPDRDKRRIHK